MIRVDIVTPSKRLASGAETTQVTLPSIKGQIMVLPGHDKMLTLLTTGVLSFPQDGVERRFAISHGFAEIRDDKVLVLAETVEEASQIDVERAKRAQKKAEEALTNVLDENHFKKYQAKLQRAVVRQQAASL